MPGCQPPQFSLSHQPERPPPCSLASLPLVGLSLGALFPVSLSFLTCWLLCRFLSCVPCPAASARLLTTDERIPSPDRHPTQTPSPAVAKVSRRACPGYSFAVERTCDALGRSVLLCQGLASRHRRPFPVPSLWALLLRQSVEAGVEVPHANAGVVANGNNLLLVGRPLKCSHWLTVAHGLRQNLDAAGKVEHNDHEIA